MLNPRSLDYPLKGPAHPPGLPTPCPWFRTPCQPSRAINPFPCDTAEGLVSSPLQPSPAQPWALLGQAYPWAHVPAQPQPVHIFREDNAPGLDCLDVPGWGSGTGPGCQTLPWQTLQEPPDAPSILADKEPPTLPVSWQFSEIFQRLPSSLRDQKVFSFT